MQTGQSQVIIKRFFEALQVLIENKVIRGKQTFATRYGINRRNMNSGGVAGISCQRLHGVPGVAAYRERLIFR